MKASLTMMHWHPQEIRRASVKRDWMEDTYHRHAYVCLPITTANTSGWEVVLQQDVVVQYDGGMHPPQILSGRDMEFVAPTGETYSRPVADSTITGVVSFPVSWVFSLPEHHALWVCGSPNYFVDGASPLSGSIPYWWPEQFNMNWKIDKINEPVVFPKGMPFMFFQIYDTRTMPSIEFEVGTVWDNKSVISERLEYLHLKNEKRVEEPWKWVGTMRSGVDHNGKRIGPKYRRPPALKEPMW